MRHRLLALLLLMLPMTLAAQNFGQNESDMQFQDGNTTRNFNPHNNDTTKQKEVPRGMYVWTVDRRFGDITRTEPDTLPHLYPQSTLAMGRTGEYSTTGSNYTARQSRIFINRPLATQMMFLDAYSQMLRQPDEWHFTNTLSPITNLSYDNCGDKTNGEDHIDAKFAVNAGKKTGLGFDLDYLYARGYYQNQSTSHFGGTFFVSHLGDRYQIHLLFSTHHQKTAENGGITSDNYITHPELYTESYSDNEIPTILSSNWNRNDTHRLFLTHRYSVGFYRKVPMTDEEIKARQFAEESAREKAAKQQTDENDSDEPLRERPSGRPDDAVVAGEAPSIAAPGPLSAQQTMTTDTTRISVESKQQADSLRALQAQQDSIDRYMKREFVPVTSFIHTAEIAKSNHTYLAYATPTGYYANTYFNYRPDGGYGGDSIYDQTQQFYVKNTGAIALLEGFNRYVPAGLKAFVTHDLRRFDMPDLDDSGTAYMSRWTEHNISVGGELKRTQGVTLHYDVTAEAWLAGEDAGQLKIDAKGDLNFRLFGDTVTLNAKAFFYRLNPTFLQRHYHSKHLWWDNNFDKEIRTQIEGALELKKTGTKLKVALSELKSYCFAVENHSFSDSKQALSTAGIMQHSGGINIVTAQLDQRLRLGPLHWDNTITYQQSGNNDVLPLPKLNVFTNLYLEFMVARVLRVELGGSATWFTRYEAPTFVPQLNQYAILQNTSERVSVGNFPFVDAYANLHLKHARFFIMMQNATGKNFNRQAFLVQHYPQNRSVLHVGVSWNFFN